MVLLLRTSDLHIETFFPYRLAVTAEAFSRQLVAVYGRKYGMSREEWRLMFLLEDARTLDSLQLAQRTSLDKVQVSRAATRLEAQGLITRKVLGSDRRLREYRITEEGITRFRDAFTEVESRANQILDAMSESEREALFKGIAALDQAIDRATQPGEGQGVSFPRPIGTEDLSAVQT